MTTQRLDPDSVKQGQRATWDAISAGWDAWSDDFERGAAEVTRRLLDLGDVGPGQRVLDVATGVGEPALTAAEAVGARGSVLGVDISPGMLDVARRRARGRENVEFAVADLEAIDRPPGSFDVVLSRWGLVFAVDRGAMLRSLADLLVPGGTLAAAVWGPPSVAPVMSLGFSVVSEVLELPPPPPDAPGPFAMSDPGQAARELEAAGFAQVSVTETVVPFEWATPEDYARFSRDVAPPVLLRAVRDRCGGEDDPRVWRAVSDAVREAHGDGSSVILPSTTWCLRAVSAATGHAGRPA
ncbi:hypothetical protein BJF83_09580 [Nocardiopsis sp. CNR-923]|uniref:class I SAM-dependent methyltransferase n=1 Tax=Nocardiopsis sp. CNR-923 TaxID=1904965 RepID=UPI000967BAEF|nr:class I SAM-dependent methyltransferase [Nocardiopsis sp. CNR-923]OLT29943.1 hypothetical protein BJF83_09580 [Nocardiopsis sp. CNR-923]